ncbi:MAG: thioesterase family protein [Acidimicrobiia bacterium]
MSFDSATAVAGGPGAWSAELEAGWDIFGVTNGGYLMAIAARAMQLESEDRSLISATGSFLNPATPGPVSIEVEVLKRGRSLSTLRATMRRDDTVLVYVTAAYSSPDRPVSDVTLSLGDPPDLPDPDDCIIAEPATDAPIPPPFTGKVEMRISPDDAAVFMSADGNQPRSRGWLRLRDGEQLDANAVVLATDAFAPAIFSSNLAVGWTPTVDLTVQVRDPHPTGWLACQFTTRFVSSGMLQEDGEIWDQSGNLVALSRQLALVPR